MAALRLEDLDQRQQLDKSRPFSGTRPSPVFQDGHAIDTDSWFAKIEERDKASTVNLAWLLSRMHGTTVQHVPSWRAFNDACSTIDPHVTTAGMMPIL